MTAAQAHADECTKCRSSYDVCESSNCAEARAIVKAERSAPKSTKPALSLSGTILRQSAPAQKQWCSDCGDVAVASCNSRLHEVH